MTDSIIDQAWLFLCRNCRADMQFAEHIRDLKYIIAPDGSLVAPVMESMILAIDAVLHVPETCIDAMEVQVSLDPFDEHGEDAGLADRWRFFHGDPPDTRWARLVIDAARYAGMVIDGEVLSRPNPLHAAEAGLCRLVNAEHVDRLRALGMRHGDLEIAEPIMVGIDPGGISLRAAFGILYVESPEPMTTEERARTVLLAMLEEHEGPADG